MKRYIITYALNFLCIFFTFAQVGIHTQSPVATLDVMALPDNPSVVDGVVAPRVEGSVLQSKNNLYNSIHEGTIVYATSASPAAGSGTDKTTNINEPGYYYFDGSFWQFMASVHTLNGLNSDNNVVMLGGPIVQPTVISGISTQNPLSFEATGTNSININNTLFSVNGTDNRLGIGTDNPQQTLDLEGTMRFKPTPPNRSPIILPETSLMYVNDVSGQVSVAPQGVPSYSGGFRPGNNFLIGTFRRDNTIARIRFVYQVDESNDLNNSATTSYTYGDFVIVGYGNANPLRFVESSIKGYDGAARPLITNTPTEISWNNGAQGTVRLLLNQTNGELRITSTTTIYSYIFEIFGGM